MEEGHEGFLAGGDGHRGHFSKLVGETKGEQMSFIGFIMALFGFGSNVGAGINPNG